MTQLVSLRTTSLPLVLFLLTACTQGQIGGEIGADPNDGEGSSGGPRCEERSKRSLREDELSSLGFSAQDLFKHVRGRHQTELVWTPPKELDSLRVTPGASTSELTLRIEPLIDTIEFIDLEPVAQKSERTEGPETTLVEEESPCLDELRFQAQVTVQSDDGAFNDRFEATFRANHSLLTTAFIPLDPAKLEGSFRLELDPDDKKTKVSNLRLQLGVVPGSVSGKISASYTIEQGEVAQGGGLDFGHFPREQCERGYFIDADSDFVRDRAEALLDVDSFDLAWSPAEKTILSIDHEVKKACLTASSIATDPPQLILSLESEVETEDERVDATWDLEAILSLDSRGAVERWTLLRQGYLLHHFPAAEFERQTGIGGDACPSGKQCSFGFSYESPATAGQASHGALVIYSVTPMSCETTPEPEEEGTSAPGCAGSDYEVLQEYEIQSRAD